MLKKLMGQSKAQLQSLVQSIDANAIQNSALRRKLAGLKRKDGGFTLLELLVVVAILAAIAGTATIMLQDTDRKGAAAAHVAMMDELSKGIQTFRVLNQGLYPNNFDSLLKNGTNVLTGATSLSGFVNTDLLANLTAGTYTAAEVNALAEVGITTAKVIDTTADANTATFPGDCSTGANILTMLLSKTSDATPQNIFKDSATGNGCGFAAGAPIASGDAVYRWTGGETRVNAQAGEQLIAFGVGPDSSLFNPSIIGSLSNVPVYRHTAPGEYNRFVVLFNAGTVAAPAGQATFQAIIDGAGDTKDEELGEVDNIRKT